jgi:nicotinamide-nucleotide amidase
MTHAGDQVLGLAELAARTDADGPVRAAVLSVGSELLLGDLTDTNATWLSLRLRELGVEVVHHLAARDDLDELVDAVRWLADRVQLIVVGGGLGPTTDDLTREALAAAAGVALEHQDELEENIRQRFAAMGRRMAPANLKQARLPAGASAYPPVGTAPGFGLTLPGRNRVRVVALPGVPWELRELFTRHVVPEVRGLAGTRATVTRIVHVVGRGESDVAEVIEPLFAGRSDATLAFLAKAEEIQVRVTVSADDPDTARAASQPLVDQVAAALGPSVAGLDDESLEAVVVRLLTTRGATLATAESATAGDIAARLGRVPGASAVLVGGAVVYATAAKHDLLGVPTELLDEHGPVSAPVTEVLAAAARARAGADWGVAVTGVAGPDPVGDLPVGTCFWALAHPDGHVEVHGRPIPGDRAQVIARLGSVALDLLRQRLLAA